MNKNSITEETRTTRVWKIINEYFLPFLVIGLYFSFAIPHDATLNLIYSPDVPFAEWDVTVVEGFEDTLFRDIEFVNETHGWLVGSLGRGAILHTNDSGLNWFVQYEREGLSFFSISVLGPDDIWVGSNRRLLHSIDGGTSWNNVSILINYPKRVEFYNASYGWVASSSELSVTLNGGATWKGIDDWPDVSLNDISVNPTIVRIATSQGIYLSNDTGTNWVLELNRTTEGISLVDNNTVWVAHPHTISLFNGIIWTEQTRVSRLLDSSYAHIEDIEFLDENTGWTVGSLPAIAHTPDGGRTWYDHVTDDIHLLAFDTYDGSYCWAAGWRGVVARTTTGNLFGPKLYKGFYLSGFSSGGMTLPYEPFFVGLCFSFSFGLIAIYYRRKHLPKKEKFNY